MRKSFFITLSFVFATLFGAQAQKAFADTSIVQYLERPETGGKVKVKQPATLAGRVERVPGVIKYDGDKAYAQTSGFRIQVFSDNNYRTAKTAARNREKLVRKTFPHLDTYVSFTAPFWRLRVGNYRTYEEANEALEELKEAFPQMTREMRIVREDKVRIEIPQNFTE